MKKQHKKIFKGKMMKNELVSVDVIHAEGEHLTADEYRRVEIEQLMQRVIDQQAEARAIRARMQAESVANSVALHYGLFPFAFACINEQPAPVFNKGDRVYVKFAIDKFEIIGGKGVNSKLDSSIFDYDVVEIETALQQEQQVRLMQGNCLELMKELPDASVDLILCDLPYGTTACKWDSVIPFDLLWEQYKRIAKDNAAIVLTASQPFTTALIASNMKQFRYTWVWEKTRPTGFQNANRMPMRSHEDILVFFSRRGIYNPQGLKPHGKINKRGSPGENWQRNDDVVNHYVQEKTGFPRTVIRFPSEGGLHPSQKPIALMEYLIRTYTNEGDLVLDNCMGSGTTGVACVNTGRKFIGMELDEDYYKVASDRISGTKRQGEQS